MVLKNVEQDLGYRAILKRCLAEVGLVSESLSPGMHAREGFIFISSPGAVTPFHMDPKHNFLLQLRGHKTINVFDPEDRGIVSAEEVDRFFGGAHRNLVFREDYQPRAQVFELRPGLGVHVPVTAPHWVRNGSEVSISFSITFQTRASARRMHAHRVNANLRKMGLTPQPVGESEASDTMKQLISRAQARMERTRARVARRRARIEARSRVLQV
jgi:oxalate decarboxylase/phosphoglucose isomerase-like protein (cupin superfamily)